jgi:RNA polymerase sigma-70 factor (ECF subfamily)
MPERGPTAADRLLVAENRALADEEVVARVCAGETALFEILMRRYNQRLFRVARGVVRNDAEAEDVVQQAYVSAYTHLAQFGGQAQFPTWLTRIALHEAFACNRRRGRRGEIDIEEHDHMKALVSDSRSPEDHASGRELTSILEAAVDQLAEPYRIVFMMREVQQLSVAETATCLQLSEENVKVRLHRAKAMLREGLYTRMTDASGEAFAFLGARCDRIVERVLAQLPSLPFPGGE